MFKGAVIGTLLAWGATLAVAQEGEAESRERLTIGHKAPGLDIAHWVKGKKVESLAEGQVYVVEFWATWCGPCIGSMPHISGVQEKYGDKVTVIGVSDEPLATVVKWLVKTDPETGKPYYERPRYRLTTDPDKSTHRAWFDAAAQSGIPASFIVGKTGVIEWIGHPMTMDGPLDAVVKGEWNREEFKSKFEERMKQELAMRAVRMKFRRALKDKDYETALGILDEQIQKRPGNPNALMQKFNLLLLTMNKPKEAYAVAGKILETGWDNWMLLNAVAWTVADDKRVTERNLELAMKAAARANELTESKNAAVLDTVARVHYERGDLDKAVEWQRKAVSHAKEDKMGAGIRKVLEKYLKEAKERAAKSGPDQ